MSAAGTPHALQQFLTEQGMEATLLHDLGDTPTVPAAAQALGVESDQIIKTLLFLVQQPTENAPTPIVVISHGERRVDKKLLARHFGVGNKKVKLASAEIVLTVLGYPAGGVPPVGHKTEVPIILDLSVLAAAARFGGTLYGGGGDDQTMLRITLAELRACVTPAEVAVS